MQIKNTGSKGKILKIHNTYDPALVYDEKYHKGDQVFVSTSEKEITGIKRDYQIAASVLILFALLLVFGRKQGVLTVISFFVSIFIFCLMMWLYTAGYDVLCVQKIKNRRRPAFPGGRPPSIISARKFNCCVRDGNRCSLSAIATGYHVDSVFFKSLTSASLKI